MFSCCHSEILNNLGVGNRLLFIVHWVLKIMLPDSSILPVKSNPLRMRINIGSIIAKICSLLSSEALQSAIQQLCNSTLKSFPFKKLIISLLLLRYLILIFPLGSLNHYYLREHNFCSGNPTKQFEFINQNCHGQLHDISFLFS